MTFTEWLKIQAEKDYDFNGYLKHAIEDKRWPRQSNSLKAFVGHLKNQGASVDICGNLLKFWAKYLKVVSCVRPISAEEIREIREVLIGMLTWIRSNNNNLNPKEKQSLKEAEGQVACLEEKEVELRYLNAQIRNNP